MTNYTRNELESAHKAISSSIRKTEKVLETLSKREPPPKPQITLATRNIAALRIARVLIEREIKETDNCHVEM